MVKTITDPQATLQALRLGIHVGEVLEVLSKIPGGPMVVRRSTVEIALGKEICHCIEVESQ